MLLRHHLNRMAEAGWLRGHPLGVVSSVAGTLNFNLAAHHGIRGATCGFASACTSGSHALGAAFDEIALGRQRRMLVVAAEDLNAESLLPFHAMNALSLSDDPATASRPFDRARDGFVGTGGAAALVLEDEESAHALAARVRRPRCSAGRKPATAITSRSRIPRARAYARRWKRRSHHPASNGRASTT